VNCSRTPNIMRDWYIDLQNPGAERPSTRRNLGSSCSLLPALSSCRLRIRLILSLVLATVELRIRESELSISIELWKLASHKGVDRHALPSAVRPKSTTVTPTSHRHPMLGAERPHGPSLSNPNIHMFKLWGKVLFQPPTSVSGSFSGSYCPKPPQAAAQKEEQYELS
jgi:hypothetical protein